MRGYPGVVRAQGLSPSVTRWCVTVTRQPASAEPGPMAGRRVRTFCVSLARNVDTIHSKAGRRDEMEDAGMVRGLERVKRHTV